MSYELKSQTFTNTNCAIMSETIAEWLAEQIPEFDYKYSSGSSSSSSFRYLAYDGTTCGLAIYGTKTNSNYSYITIYTAWNITESTGTYLSNYLGASVTTSNKDGADQFSVSVYVLKISTGYIISIGKAMVYIGWHTSALAGKKLYILKYASNSICTGVACFKSNVAPSTNYAYNTVFSEDGTEYNYCNAITIAPDKVNAPAGSAVLCPLYLVADSLWSEPVLLPDLYHFVASSYPEWYTPTQVGDTEVYRCGYSIVAV